MKIKSIKKIQCEPVSVYDIEVEKYHNFAVGKDKLIVHNCEYLHGNADNVICNLAQDHCGTNNLPLLQKKGNFGTRFSPDPSASRYIYTYGSKELFTLFKKEDNDILINQNFEGHKIEPMFYVPNLPILLINGSEGVSSGFAQKILPRNPECIKQYIKDYLKEPLGNVRASQKTSLIPFYNGFKGTIEKGATSVQWTIKGIVKRLSSAKVEITEVPIGYDLKGYIKVLDDLEDKGVIKSYKDKSEDDNFNFEVSFTISDLKKLSDDDLYDTLKLVKRVSENYTCIDENNKIAVFDSAKEILDKYIQVKLQYMEKRKDNEIDKLTTDIKYDYSKYLFIKKIVDEEIIINKRKKSEIETILEKFPEILKSNDSYDYLLNMSIMTLTEERLKKLQDDIKTSKAKLDKLTETSIEQLWLDEIKF